MSPRGMQLVTACLLGTTAAVGTATGAAPASADIISGCVGISGDTHYTNGSYMITYEAPVSNVDVRFLVHYPNNGPLFMWNPTSVPGQPTSISTMYPWTPTTPGQYLGQVDIYDANGQNLLREGNQIPVDVLPATSVTPPPPPSSVPFPTQNPVGVGSFAVTPCSSAFPTGSADSIPALGGPLGIFGL